MENENQLNLILEVLNVIVLNTEEQKKQLVLESRLNEQILQQFDGLKKNVLIVNNNLKIIADILKRNAEKSTAENSIIIKHTKKITADFATIHQQIITTQRNHHLQMMEKYKRIRMLAVTLLILSVINILLVLVLM